MLRPNELRDYVEKQLSEYVDSLSGQCWRMVRDFAEGAGRDRNSTQARVYAAAVVYREFKQSALATPSDFTLLLNLLVEKIENIQIESSRLRAALLAILNQTAHYLRPRPDMAAVAEVAFAHADRYFNETIQSELTQYAAARLSSSVITKLRNVGLGIEFAELVRDVNTPIKVHSAACAKYLAEKLAQCQNPKDYYELVLSMSAILNFEVDRIDVPLRELILSCERRLLSRYVITPRLPEFPDNLKLLLYRYARLIENKSKIDPVSELLASSCHTQLERLALSVGPRELRAVVGNELQALHAWKEADKQARHNDKIKHFHTALVDKILPLLLFEKIAQSGKIELPPGRKAAIGGLLQKLLNLPVLNLAGAGILGDIIGAGFNALDHHERIEANHNVNESAQIHFLAQIDPFVLQLANKISLRYFQQIRHINLDTECEQINKIADCAVERIFQYMESGEVTHQIKSAKGMGDIVDVLVLGISDYSMRHGVKIPVINYAISNAALLMSVDYGARKNDLTTDMTIEEMFANPGLMVITEGIATFYYHPKLPHANLDMIEKYGFVLASVAEVKMLGLELLTPQVLARLPADKQDSIRAKMNHPLLPKNREALKLTSSRGADELLPPVRGTISPPASPSIETKQALNRSLSPPASPSAEILPRVSTPPTVFVVTEVPAQPASPPHVETPKVVVAQRITSPDSAKHFTPNQDLPSPAPVALALERERQPAAVVVAAKPASMAVVATSAAVMKAASSASIVMPTKPAPTVMAAKPTPAVMVAKPAPAVKAAKPAPAVEAAKPAPAVEAAKSAPAVVTVKPAPVAKPFELEHPISISPPPVIQNPKLDKILDLLDSPNHAPGNCSQEGISAEAFNNIEKAYMQLLQEATSKTVVQYLKALEPAMSVASWHGYCQLWLLGAGIDHIPEALYALARHHYVGSAGYDINHDKASFYLSRALRSNDINVQTQALIFAEAHPTLELADRINDARAQLQAPTTLFAPVTPPAQVTSRLTAAQMLESTAASSGHSK